MNEDVIEVMLNPDGVVWYDTLSQGRQQTDIQLSASDSERVNRIIASKIGSACDESNPIITAELPEYNARFQGVVPPVVPRHSFCIRKKALRLFTLDDYVAQGIINCELQGIIKQTVQNKQNIIISGGAGTGKTTFANAVLAEIKGLNERVITIEDTLELQCAVQDSVSLKSVDGIADMNRLVKCALRMRPIGLLLEKSEVQKLLNCLKHGIQDTLVDWQPFMLIAQEWP